MGYNSNKRDRRDILVQSQKPVDKKNLSMLLTPLNPLRGTSAFAEMKAHVGSPPMGESEG